MYDKKYITLQASEPKLDSKMVNLVHKSFLQLQKIEKKLSVYDGDQINAEDSWKHFTNTLGLSSKGTLAITVSEFEEEDLVVVPDSETFKEHTLVDFSDYSKNQIKSKAKKTKTKSTR